MAAVPPSVSASEVLSALGNTNVAVAAPPKAPATVSSTQVQSVVTANSITVGEFTAKERARAAVKLTYFVGCIISFVIVMVFVDYLARMPATPDNSASNQPVPQTSPVPATPSPQATPSVQATATMQQTTFMHEAAFSQAPPEQATPVPPGTTPKPAAIPALIKPASPEASPVVQIVATAPKTPAENYVFISNAIADRSSKMFNLIVVRALLPVFTALLGYIFGSQPARSNT